MEAQASKSLIKLQAKFSQTRHLVHELFAGPAEWGGLLIGTGISLGFAIWLYRVEFLLGTSAYWLQQDADITQYIAGFNAFMREPWQWPILRISSINWPGGTLATFVDAIPLYAVVLKLFRNGADAPFWNPYGAWVAISYLLQGIGAWWICREAEVKSWITLAVLACLLASFPALSYRVVHISLMSQWLLIFAFAVYLRSTRKGMLAWRTWTVLIFCAFYINIYLFSMVSIVFAVDAGRFLRRQDWRNVVPTLAVPYGLLALSLFVTMLPLPAGSGTSEGGFGYYSMNVLSPLAGGKFLQWPNPVANDGQGEGFNYLGVFLVGLFIYSISLRLRHDRLFWSRHMLLLSTLFTVILYAVSNKVYIGTLHLFDVYMPSWTAPLTGQLRVSGRFFWLVGYAVVIFTVLTVVRYAGLRRPNSLLVVLLLLHLWDLGPHHSHVRSIANPPKGTVRLDNIAWDRFLGSHIKTLYFYPSFGCGKGSPHATLLPTMRYAAERRLNLSTGYVARAAKLCDEYQSDISSTVNESVAFVFVKEEIAGMPRIEELFGGVSSVHCAEVGFAYLCKRTSKIIEGKKL